MKNIIIILSILTICGCATPYQPTGFAGGYSETQLAPDLFRVNFNGNGYTSRVRSQDFVMLRGSGNSARIRFTSEKK